MKRITRRIISIVITAFLVVACCDVSFADTTKAIKNNGLNGIYVDINSQPYTSTEKMMRTLKVGCTWYVGARIGELTGRNPGIHAGKPWWNNGKGNYGYNRAGKDAPTEKAVVCYTNHVSIVEAFDGEKYTISEGGNQSGKESEKYCQITTRTLSQIKSLSGSSGSFLGFVYLGIPFPQADTEAPEIRNALTSNITSTGFDISCIATDNVDVDRVYFPTWTKNNGQDDIVWHVGIEKGGRYLCHIDISQHNNETGTYISHVYAYDKAGNQSMDEIKEFKVGVFPNDIRLDKSSMELYVGDTAKLNATVNPADAVDKSVNWLSDNKNVITVDKGTIKAVGPGTATVTAQLYYWPLNGHYFDECKVAVKEKEKPEEKTETVNDQPKTDDQKKKDDSSGKNNEEQSTNKDVPVTGVRILTRPSCYRVGDMKYLSFEFIPANCTNKWAKWSSSNTDVAVVVDDGWLVCLEPGETTISILTKDGGFTDSFNLTVVSDGRCESESYSEDPSCTDDSNENESNQEERSPESDKDSGKESSRPSYSGPILKSGTYKASGITAVETIDHSGYVIEDSDGYNTISFFWDVDGTYKYFDSNYMYVITVTSDTTYTYEIKDPDTNVRRTRRYYSLQCEKE